jgi:ABC-2 type transport system permease protein
MSQMMIQPVKDRLAGWRLFLMSIRGRSYPRIIGMQRDVTWLIFDVLMPIGTVAAYVLIYQAVGAPSEYVGFVVVGGAMMAYWLNVLWGMSSQLYWEKETGNLTLYIIAPAPMMSILLGMALGGIFASSLRALGVIIIASWIFHVSYAVTSFWLLFLTFLLTMAALYGLGMMTSSIFLLLNREAWHIANLAQEPVYLASGFYFPIKSFPFWIAAGASIIPLTLGLDAMRQLVFPSGSSLGFLSVQVEVFFLVVLSVVFIAGAKWMLDYMERLARREGRLTDTRK